MNKITEAIILAGGKGKRLRSVTMNEIPKPLAPIQNRPILEWEMDWLSREGINHVILAIGHLSDKIINAFGDSYQSPSGEVQISYSVEKEKLGSGGAVKLATKKLTTSNCYLVNGDVMCNSHLQEMSDLHFETGSLATMYLTRMLSPYGVVLSEGKLITEFLEKPYLDVFIHGGIDIVDTDIISRFPDKGQMEETIFLELVKENKFGAFNAGKDDFWLSVDSEKDFEIVNADWKGLDNIN